MTNDKIQDLLVQVNQHGMSVLEEIGNPRKHYSDEEIMMSGLWFKNQDGSYAITKDINSVEQNKNPILREDQVDQWLNTETEVSGTFSGGHGKKVHYFATKICGQTFAEIRMCGQMTIDVHGHERTINNPIMGYIVPINDTRSPWVYTDQLPIKLGVTNRRYPDEDGVMRFVSGWVKGSNGRLWDGWIKLSFLGKVIREMVPDLASDVVYTTSPKKASRTPETIHLSIPQAFRFKRTEMCDTIQVSEDKLYTFETAHQDGTIQVFESTAENPVAVGRLVQQGNDNVVIVEFMSKDIKDTPAGDGIRKEIRNIVTNNRDIRV